MESSVWTSHQPVLVAAALHLQQRRVLELVGADTSASGALTQRNVSGVVIMHDDEQVLYQAGTQAFDNQLIYAEEFPWAGLLRSGDDADLALSRQRVLRSYRKNSVPNLAVGKILESMKDAGVQAS